MTVLPDDGRHPVRDLQEKLWRENPERERLEKLWGERDDKGERVWEHRAWTGFGGRSNGSRNALPTLALRVRRRRKRLATS